MSIRLTVLEDSITIEAMVSKYLCSLLDVPSKSSRLFGERSGSLPVSTKIQLLLEIDYFNDLMKRKFSRFFEIRNKFAHLHSVIDFTSCFERLEGIEKDLFKWYPEVKRENFTDEEKMRKVMYLSLFSDVLGDIQRFTEFYMVKMTNDLRLKQEARFLSQYSEALDQAAESDPILLLAIKKCWEIAIEKTKVMPPFEKPRYLSDLDDDKQQ